MQNKERYCQLKKITDALKKIIDLISDKTKLSPKILLAAVLLAAGVAALLISEIPQNKKRVSSPVSTTEASQDPEEYTRKLEERLTSIISAIDGAGETKVMITLESSSEDIYLHDFDYGENADSSGKNSFERKDEYVIVDGSSGEQGIVVRKAEPKIRGVAVVCKGAGSEIVREQIVQAVTALLDISSARVSVAKMN